MNQRRAVFCNEPNINSKVLGNKLIDPETMIYK